MHSYGLTLLARILGAGVSLLVLLLVTARVPQTEVGSTLLCWTTAAYVAALTRLGRDAVVLAAASGDIGEGCAELAKSVLPCCASSLGVSFALAVIADATEVVPLSQSWGFVATTPMLTLALLGLELLKAAGWVEVASLLHSAMPSALVGAIALALGLSGRGPLLGALVLSSALMLPVVFVALFANQQTRRALPDVARKLSKASRGEVAGGLPVMISDATFMGVNWIPFAAVAGFGTPSQLALFGTASRVGAGLNVAVAALHNVGGPVVAKELQSGGDMAGLRAVQARVSLSAAPIVAGVAISVVLFEEWLLKLLGDEFAGVGLLVAVFAIAHGVRALGVVSLLLLALSERRYLLYWPSGTALLVCVALSLSLASFAVSFVPLAVVAGFGAQTGLAYRAAWGAGARGLGNKLMSRRRTDVE